MGEDPGLVRVSVDNEPERQGAVSVVTDVVRGVMEGKRGARQRS